jgi:hypothetical protein
MYTADAVRGFMEDLKRPRPRRRCRGDDVHGIRAARRGEGSLGTDLGTATPMFVVAGDTSGGLFGRHPSLTDVDDGNMTMTTDFRRVYATTIKEWLGYDKPRRC